MNDTAAKQRLDQRRSRLRRLTLNAVLIALALALSIAERWIPLELLVPVPGVKLGLANVVTLFALFTLTTADAWVILVIRCLILGAVLSPSALAFSLTGGSLALLLMCALRGREGRFMSAIGVSIAGAAAHQVGQVAVASVLLGEARLLVTYLPPLLLIAIATGTLTGFAARPVVRLFRNVNLKRKTVDRQAPG